MGIGLEKRAKLGIISLILEVSSTDANDTKKITKIMYNTLLNNPRLKGYWTALTEVGLLTYDNTTQTFKTTEKGLRFLQVFSELDQLSREERERKKNNSI
jgi:predicted transcriptional regulator